MVVNGEHFSLAELQDRSVLGLVHHFKLDPETVAVERNGSIPDRSTWKQVLLANEDRVELIRFVGGG